jgi:hypothetical protein
MTDLAITSDTYDFMRRRCLQLLLESEFAHWAGKDTPHPIAFASQVERVWAICLKTFGSNRAGMEFEHLLAQHRDVLLAFRKEGE